MPQGLAAVSRELERLTEAIAAGRLLPGGQDSAFAALDPLKRSLPPDQYVAAENRLRVAATSLASHSRMNSIRAGSCEADVA